MTDHAREAALETDIIGGFPIAQPHCLGCGKELLIENAWMTDGCPCNHVLGVNNQNETRWRLLMRLQQRQQYQQSEAIAAATAELRVELERVKAENRRLRLAIAGNMGGNDLIPSSPIEELERACQASLDALWGAWSEASEYGERLKSIEFWRDMVGVRSAEDVERQMADFKFLLENAAKVYDAVTGGKISKPMICADLVLAEADRLHQHAESAEAALAESQARAERAEGQVAELEAAEQRRSEAARQHLDWHGKNIDEAYKSYE